MKKRAFETLLIQADLLLMEAMRKAKSIRAMRCIKDAQLALDDANTHEKEQAKRTIKLSGNLAWENRNEGDQV